MTFFLKGLKKRTGQNNGKVERQFYYQKSYLEPLARHNVYLNASMDIKSPLEMKVLTSYLYEN